MAAIRVNNDVPQKFNLKRLAKKRKMIGGDGGFISNRILNRNK